MKYKLNYLLIIIIPFMFILYLYLLLGAIHNNIRSTNIKLSYNEIEKYIKVDDKKIFEISKTNSFKKIFETVFKSNIKCSIYGYDCLSYKEILNIVDKDVDNLCYELNYKYSNKEIRSLTLLYIKELYDDNSFKLNVNFSEIDVLFSVKQLKKALYFLSIILFIIILISSVDWLKFSSMSLMISSLFVIIASYLVKGFSFLLINSGTKISAAMVMNKLSSIPIKYCMYYFIMGVCFTIIYIVFKTIVKKQN